MNDEALTIREIADYLKIGDKTVYSLAQKRRIPAFKVGSQWRSGHGDLDAWIARRPPARLMRQP